MSPSPATGLVFASGPHKFEKWTAAVGRLRVRRALCMLGGMSVYGQFCPVAMALEVVGERWTLLIVRELLTGNFRFGEILHGVPLISRSLLSQRLKALEDANLIDRRERAAGNGHEYCLTPAGEELRPIRETCLSAGGRCADKVFGRRFFVFREDVALTSGDSGEECRVGDLPELDRGGHGPATGQGDPPATRAGDLGDESVCVQTAEQPGDLRWLFVVLWCQRIRGAPQLLSHIAVREAVQGVLPCQEHLEEHALVA